MADSSNKPDPSEAPKKDKVPLEELPKEELLRCTKKYIDLLRTAKTKYSELNAKCSSLEEERDGAFVILAELKKKCGVGSIDELHNKIHSLESSIHKLSDDNEELSTQLDEKNRINNSLLKEKLETDEKLQCLDMQVDTIRRSSKCLQEECSKLTNQNKELEQQMQTIIQQRNDSQQSLKLISEELESTKLLTETQTKELQVLKSDFEAKIQNVESDLSKTLEDKLLLEKSLAEIKNNKLNNVTSNQHQSLQADVTEGTKVGALEEIVTTESNFEDVNKQLSKYITELESRILMLKNEVEENQSLNVDLATENAELRDDAQILKSKITTLEISFSESKSLNEILHKEKNKLEANESSLQSKISKLESDLNEFKSKNDELCKEKNEFQCSKSTVESKFAALESDLNESKIIQDTLSSEKCELQKTVIALESKFLTSESDLNESKIIQDRLLSEKCELQETVIALESRKAALEFDLNESKIIQDKLSSEKCELQETVIALESKFAALEFDLNESKVIQDKLSNEKCEFQETVIALESKFSTSESDLNESKIIQDKLSNEKSELQETVKSLESQLAKSSENLNSVISDRNSIISEIKNRFNINLGVESDFSLDHLQRMIEQNCKDQHSQCEELEMEISNLKTQVENHKEEVETWKEKVNVLNKEKLEYSNMMDTYKSDLKEIESLRQQLDEYENDIQKHETLEKTNYELQDTLDELEGEYFKLNEQLEFKCSELNDLTFHLDSLTMMLKQEELKFNQDVSTTDDNEMPDIFILKSLCERLCLELNKATALKFAVETVTKDKETISKELVQVQDLKQFLEDEVTELREEIKQLKAAAAEKQDVTTETICSSIASGVSEWGFAEVPMPENLDKVDDLQKQLEAKSSLVESIHCEMDLLMGKVEELTTELAEKESEIIAAQQSKVNAVIMAKKVKKAFSMLMEVKTDSSSQLDEFRLFYSYFEQETDKVLNKILSCYQESEALLQSYKSQNDNLIIDCKQVLQMVFNSLEFLEVNKIRFIPLDETVQFERVNSENCIGDLLLYMNNLKEILMFIEKLPPLQTMSEDMQENSQNVSEISCTTCQQTKNDLAEVELRSNKLKALAVKIKKELNESHKKCQSLLEEKNAHQQKIQELSEDVSMYVRNFQNLQSEYDKLQDECEHLKSNNSRVQGDLISTLDELDIYKKKLSDSEMNMKVTLESLNSGQVEKTGMKDKIAELDSKFIVSDTKLQESQTTNNELKEELNRIQQIVKTLENEKLLLAKQVQDALMQTKQKSLLDLEMADYERTIAELNECLDKKNADALEVKGEIETLNSRIQSLEEEVQFCESHRKTEEKRAEGFKITLDNCKKELSALRESESTSKSDATSLRVKLETLSLEEQEYKSQLSQQSAELMQMKEMLRTSNDNHQRIVQSLNSKLSTQKQDILLANKEVESVKQDFENYKIRVHSVLKQQRTVSPFASDDAEVKEKLEAQNEKLKLKLKELSEKLNANILENESLQEEHDHLLQRHSKVVEELESKDRSWNQQFEQILEEKNKIQILLEKLSSEYSLKNEMLASTYKKQMKILQADHKHALAELQKQLESADIEISRLHREQQRNNHSLSASTIAQDDNSNIFDISSIERQEGEGSECTEDGNTSINRMSLATIPTAGFLSLDKLLQSPMELHTPTSIVSNQDSEQLSAELNSSWKKIDHLSQLLNESEANNLRLGEQVRVLKEEFRRQERNHQRGEHAENLEYLKNVFIKFTTLESGDEKARLVPVLNMILKLSPSELEQLRKVAGGSDAIDASSNSWGNYLHRWSGLM